MPGTQMWPECSSRTLQTPASSTVSSGHTPLKSHASPALHRGCRSGDGANAGSENTIAHTHNCIRHGPRQLQLIPSNIRMHMLHRAPLHTLQNPAEHLCVSAGQ